MALLKINLQTLTVLIIVFIEQDLFSFYKKSYFFLHIQFVAHGYEKFYVTEEKFWSGLKYLSTTMEATGRPKWRRFTCTWMLDFHLL